MRIRAKQGKADMADARDVNRFAIPADEEPAQLRAEKNAVDVWMEHGIRVGGSVIRRRTAALVLLGVPALRSPDAASGFAPRVRKGRWHPDHAPARVPARRLQPFPAPRPVAAGATLGRADAPTGSALGRECRAAAPAALYAAAFSYILNEEIFRGSARSGCNPLRCSGETGKAIRATGEIVLRRQQW